MKYVIYFFSYFFLISEKDIINTRLECPFFFEEFKAGLLLNLIEIDSEIFGDVNFENINLYFKYNFYEKELDQFDFYLNVFVNINCIFEFQVKIIVDFFSIFMCKYLNFSFEVNILDFSHAFYFKFLKNNLFNRIKFEFNFNLEKVLLNNSDFFVKEINNLDNINIQEQNNLLDESIEKYKIISKKLEVLSKKSNLRKNYITNLKNALTNCEDNIEKLKKSLTSKVEINNLKFFFKRIGIESNQIKDILIKNNYNDFKKIYEEVIRKKYRELSLLLHPDKNKNGVVYINEMSINMQDLNGINESLNKILCLQ